MAATELTIDEALQRISAMPYAYIRSISKVTFGTAPSKLDLEELIEARYFYGNSEIRLFRRNDELKAAEIFVSEAEQGIRRAYEIANPKLGSSYKMIELISFDTDGQANICDTMLTEWEA